MTDISCFFVEFTGTTILALMIVASTDKYNMASSKGLLPLTLFLVLLGLGAALGMQTCECPLSTRDCLGARVENPDAINLFFSICSQSSP